MKYSTIYRYGCQPDVQRNEAVLVRVQKCVAELGSYLGKDYYV